MARSEPSRPLRLLLEQKIINKKTSVFDFGSGRGADIEFLSNLGIKCRGWDPTFAPKTKKVASEIVTLTYVLNVIEDTPEREKTLQDAWNLATSVLAISVRLEDERDESHIKPRADGWMTSRNTFQKFFDHSEFGVWIEKVLNVDAIPAGPGVFLLFKKIGEREQYLARRYEIRIPSPHIRKSDKKFIDNKNALQPLIDFFLSHGRLPKSKELENEESLIKIFGSIGHAFRVIEVVTNREEWISISEKRRVDLLVFLALRQLDGPFKLGDLDPSMRIDIRTHHKNFTNATTTANKLLFSAGNPNALNLAARSSTIGKLTPSALYVHTDALQYLPALLKIYEGCARRIIGQVPEANLVKLHRDSLKVSYLSYPNFDSDPHPTIKDSFLVDLTSLRFKRQRFNPSRNLPILHRKETFIHKTDSRYDTFADLTSQEVAAGLYENPSEIGYRDHWNALLKTKGISFDKHQLVTNN